MFIGKKQDIVLKKIIGVGGCVSHDSMMRIIYSVYRITTGSISMNRKVAMEHLQPFIKKRLINIDGDKKYWVTNRAYQKLGINKQEKKLEDYHV